MNNNSYLSIGIVVLVILATLWIKDGQNASANANAKVSNDLENYKQLQIKDAEILKNKIDGLTSVVQSATADKWTQKDVRRIWSEFGALNPQLKLPTLP